MLDMTRKLFAIAAVGVLLSCATAQGQAEPETYAPGRFSVEVTGQGPDVILIPGLASSRDVWDATVAQLQTTHRVHALQLAGFAGEPAGAASEGAILAPFVEDLNRYIEANHLERPAVIGHSLGGLSALMLAKDHPETVGRVMVVDALPFFSVLMDPNATVASITPAATTARNQMQSMAPEQFAAGQMMTMNRLVRTETLRFTALNWSLETDRSVMARAMYEVMTTDVRADLASIQTPVTIVYANDPAIAPEPMITGLYTNAYAALPNHRLVKVDQSFHFVQLDNPAAFAAALEDFLR